MEVKYLLIQLYLYRARLNGSPQLWWILLLLLLPSLPVFACSIHATWGLYFSQNTVHSSDMDFPLRP